LKKASPRFPKTEHLQIGKGGEKTALLHEALFYALKDEGRSQKGVVLKREIRRKKYRLERKVHLGTRLLALKLGLWLCWALALPWGGERPWQKKRRRRLPMTLKLRERKHYWGQSPGSDEKKKTIMEKRGTKEGTKSGVRGKHLSGRGRNVVLSYNINSPGSPLLGRLPWGRGRAKFNLRRTPS